MAKINFARDLTLVFERNSYPENLKIDRFGTPRLKKRDLFCSYIKESTGIEVDHLTFKEKSDSVSVRATVKNYTDKQKVYDFIQMNESCIVESDNKFHLEDGINAYYVVNEAVYSPFLLKEDVELDLGIVEVCVKMGCLDVFTDKMLRGVYENVEQINESESEEPSCIDISDIIYIVETSNGYVLEDLQEDIEEIYEDNDFEVDEDDAITVEEKIVAKKLIRGGRVVLKKKATRAGYKFKDGREMRMTSREQRDRKIAQMKAARKRRSKVGKSQKLRAKSLGIRTKRFGSH